MTYIAKNAKGLYLYAINSNGPLFCKKKGLAIRLNCSKEQALTTITTLENLSGSKLDLTEL